MVSDMKVNQNILGVQKDDREVRKTLHRGGGMCTGLKA